MFDPVTTTATELLQQLRDGQLTSVDIINVYLSQIESHNHNGLKLNALISVAPRDLLIDTAQRLDRERRNGQVRSALHGIPIAVKDSIVTSAQLGMPTTNGSLAFKEAKAVQNAECVERLVEAGMIILAKANLTEASGMKSDKMTPGWSSAGGQTQTPYVFPSNQEGEQILGDSRPGGSSSGSAVAVAAGFAPLSLGTEAVGSLVTPANRAALYALKLPPAVSPNAGIFGISTTFDGVGGMAKSADDLALLTALLTKKPDLVQRTTPKALLVGFVDPRKWQLPEAACKVKDIDARQMVDNYENAIKAIQASNVGTVYPVIVPSTETLKSVEENPYRKTAFHQCQEIFTQTAAMFENCNIKTIADMVRWNNENADIAMPDACPDQKDLDDTLAFQQDAGARETLHSDLRRLGGPEGVDPIFKKDGLDIIAAPTDSSFVCFSACAGYPVGCVPLGVLKKSGRPFGICVMARSGGESALLRFMSGWEKVFPERALPRPLVNWQPV